jgi:hypothetical protein
VQCAARRGEGGIEGCIELGDLFGQQCGADSLWRPEPLRRYRVAAPLRSGFWPVDIEAARVWGLREVFGCRHVKRMAGNTDETIRAAQLGPPLITRLWTTRSQVDTSRT